MPTRSDTQTQAGSEKLIANCNGTLLMRRTLALNRRFTTKTGENHQTHTHTHSSLRSPDPVLFRNSITAQQLKATERRAISTTENAARPEGILFFLQNHKSPEGTNQELTLGAEGNKHCDSRYNDGR
jgi:hypothetical protein